MNFVIPNRFTCAGSPGAMSARVLFMPPPSEPTRDIFETGVLGIRHDGLRRSNEKAVLTIVGFNAGLSNAEIARLSGLAPQTVSAILVDLENEGLIERGPVLRGRRGQPATPILLNAAAAYSIGVEIGWQHVSVVLLNFHAQVLDERRADYQYPDAKTLFSRICAMVEDLRAGLDADQRRRLRDLGIAMPGNVADHVEMLDAPPDQTVLWRQTDPVAELRERTGLEVSLYNDGNAACWAELIALAPPRPSNVLYFLVSRYIAAGVIAGGVLWEGPSGQGADLGSMVVEAGPDGVRQAYAFASKWALQQRLAQAGKAQPLDVAQWDWHDIAPELDTWLADSGEALARAVFNATTVVEQPLVVIDSILPPEVTARLVACTETALAQLPVRGFRPPKVIAGQYGALAPAIGAAKLILFRRYF